MHIVEISPPKQLTVGDTCTQRNHIANEFRAFFDNKKTGVAQFWRWEGPQIRPGSTPFWPKSGRPCPQRVGRPE